MTTASLARRAAASPRTSTVLVNVLAFQAGWWAEVLSAARDHAAIGLLVVGLVLAWHLARVRPGRAEAALIAVAACIGLAFDSLHEQNPLKMDKSMFALQYTYYRFFVQFLIDEYGQEKFQAYLKEYLRAPLDYKQLFPKVFGNDLDVILEKFDSYMRQEG